MPQQIRGGSRSRLKSAYLEAKKSVGWGFSQGVIQISKGAVVLKGKGTSYQKTQ